MPRLPEIFAFICMLQRVCQKQKPTKLKIQATFVIHLIFTSISPSRRRQKPLRQSNERYRGRVANLKGTECRAILISITKWNQETMKAMLEIQAIHCAGKTLKNPHCDLCIYANDRHETEQREEETVC